GGGMAQRAGLDWLKAKAQTQVPFSALGSEHAVEELLPCTDAPALDQDDDRRQLLAEVEALPEDCRKVVLLYYYEDLTYRELAQLLGVSPATVNARAPRAGPLLRERLSRAWRGAVDCEQAVNLISAQIDHEIRPDERALLEEHLGTCGACAATAEAFRLQDAELRQAFVPR